jgi:hypothetical protein
MDDLLARLKGMQAGPGSGTGFSNIGPTLIPPSNPNAVARGSTFDPMTGEEFSWGGGHPITAEDWNYANPWDDTGDYAPITADDWDWANPEGWV